MFQSFGCNLWYKRYHAKNNGISFDWFEIAASYYTEARCSFLRGRSNDSSGSVSCCSTCLLYLQDWDVARLFDWDRVSDYPPFCAQGKAYRLAVRWISRYKAPTEVRSRVYKHTDEMFQNLLGGSEMYLGIFGYDIVSSIAFNHLLYFLCSWDLYTSRLTFLFPGTDSVFFSD